MNKKIVSVVSTLLLSFGGVLGAAEGVSAYAEAQRKVKEKFPKEYAEIEKLAATDMSAAMRKLTSLAEKSGIRTKNSRRQWGNSDRGRMTGNRNGGSFNRRRGEGRGMMGGFPGMNPFGRIQAESKIAEKFPAEFAAAVKQMNEAEKTMAALAEKAEVNLPASFETQVRMLQEKEPVLMAEVRKKFSSDPRAAMAALRSLAEKYGVKLSGMAGGRRGGRGEWGHDAEKPAPPQGREMSRPSFSKLRAVFPGEMARYEELRRQDPGAARELLRQLSAKLMKTGKVEAGKNK